MLHVVKHYKIVIIFIVLWWHISATTCPIIMFTCQIFVVLLNLYVDLSDIMSTCQYGMVAYFCHHLSDKYVNLSDLYVDWSVIYVDLSDHYVDLSKKYHHN